MVVIMEQNKPVWHFSHEQDIEAVFILWNYYKQNIMSSVATNFGIEQGIPQSLSYLQRRTGVDLNDLNEYSLKYYGYSFSGIDSINPDKFGRG